MSNEDRHNCNFSCKRAACIESQRDELWRLAKPIYDEMQRREPAMRMTFSETMRVAAKQLEDMP